MKRTVVACGCCGSPAVLSLCPQCSALEFELGLRGAHGGSAALDVGVDRAVFARRGPKHRRALAVFDLGGPGLVFRAMRELMDGTPLDRCGEELRVLRDLVPRVELAGELDAWSGGLPCSVSRVYRREAAARG